MAGVEEGGYHILSLLEYVHQERGRNILLRTSGTNVKCQKYRNRHSLLPPQLRDLETKLNYVHNLTLEKEQFIPIFFAHCSW